MRYITPEACIRYRLGELPTPRWPAALMVFRDKAGSTKVLEAMRNVRPVPHKLLYNSCGPELSDGCVFRADLNGSEILVLTRCVWGGPQAAILVEELAWLGVRTIVGYGLAGSMDPAVGRGRLIAASAALPSDGTSRAYGCADPLVADATLLKSAQALAGDALTPVTAATVDALYRETHELIAAYRSQGAHVVNMETSPFYAAGRACSVRTLWLGYVSDHLADGKWDDWYVPAPQAAEDVIALCKAVLSEAIGQADAGAQRPIAAKGDGDGDVSRRV